MLSEEARRSIARQLLDELVKGERATYYIAMGPNAAIVDAFGPTDAWRVFYSLGLYIQGNGTETAQIDRPERIRPEWKYRLLTPADLATIEGELSAEA